MDLVGWLAHARSDPDGTSGKLLSVWLSFLDKCQSLMTCSTGGPWTWRGVMVDDELQAVPAVPHGPVGHRLLQGSVRQAQQVNMCTFIDVICCDHSLLSSPCCHYIVSYANKYLHGL